MLEDASSFGTILAICGGIDFSALSTAQIADSVYMAAFRQQSWDFNLGAFLLDQTTQPCYMVCPLVSRVPLYLSSSTTIFFTPFMASATQVYGQPSNKWPSSTFDMASVDRLENGPIHASLSNKSRSISTIVPHYLSTISTYFSLTM